MEVVVCLHIVEQEAGGLRNSNKIAAAYRGQLRYYQSPSVISILL
jgi:hypothetical protein